MGEDRRPLGLLREKNPADRSLDAEQGKEAWENDPRRHFFRPGAAAQIHVLVVDSGDS